MKRFKVLFALLAVVAVSAATLAFKSAKKFTAVTYYYTGANKFIASGSGANQLTSTEVLSTANYTTVNPGYSLVGGNYLAAIVIDEPTLDITDAAAAVWSKFQENFTLPTHEASFSPEAGVNITILRKASN